MKRLLCIGLLATAFSLQAQVLVNGNAGQISGLAASATIDTTNAGNITSGTLPAAQLPNSTTNAQTINVDNADALILGSGANTQTRINFQSRGWVEYISGALGGLGAMIIQGSGRATCFGSSTTAGSTSLNACFGATPGQFWLGNFVSYATATGVRSDGSSLFVSGVYGSAVGTAISSAATIAPTASIFHVTGTAAISTMTPPTGMSSTVGGFLTLIADGAWSLAPGSTAGQFKSALTATAGTQYYCTYDGTLWYCK